ncbi:sulfite exporter TauE/SafE family protein [Hyphomicrobium sp.]|uniref:sulfite exporter TauE/SafE family protein n=1 Tax=Hyphomicrobium sp. TaxID=82 RepID=UPI000FB33783|nr:sulfite exporter TauE/SafE family protein [Hyphomicrobium sp.]RUP09161.1 MAG: sulfite exporter TauE/SafE family protein [Hyphomicrobium sp.]
MLSESLLSGAAVGLASAFHCGAMCGGIACGANLLLGAKTSGDRNLNLLLMQAGRILTYTAIGAVAGTFGGDLLSRTPAQSPIVLQWAAAASLLWMGLVLAGLMPRLTFIDHGMQVLSSGVNSLLRPAGQGRYLAPVALGVVWGLNACPMVYGAALLASLMRTSAQGATFMLGFGAGTVPAVIASAYGISWLNRRAAGTRLNLLAGLILMTAGAAVVYFPQHFASVLCVVR